MAYPKKYAILDKKFLGKLEQMKGRKELKILAIGDLVGESGVRKLKELLPKIREEEKIDFVITKTEPGIKGNTATNATKDAIIETGMLVKVPLFIEQGEEIIVSTKDGKYVSRK